jgi:hypothetical protein
MCFSNWQWSITGQDFLGDYIFLVSTDAHSGRYAAGFQCTNPNGDCQYASVFTDRILTTPGKSYKASVYTKCPAGPTANKMTIEGEPGNGDSGDEIAAQPLTCTGDWTYAEVTFTPPASDFWINVYDVGTSPLLVDDLVLTYADGSVPDAPIPAHTGVRNVGISGQTVVVDGAPYLALGFFDVPYEDIAMAAATNANTVQAVQTNAAADCFLTENQSYLDALYEAGLNFVPHSNATAHSAAQANLPSAMAATTPRFAPHLANIAWLMDDEPDQDYFAWAYVPPAMFINEYNAIKPTTYLPIFADFQRIWWETQDDVGYTPGVDFWMGEPYGTDFSHINLTVNAFNSLQRRPIWLAQDAIDPNLIVPKAYWAIVNGVTGIIYFSWTNFKADPPTLAAATQAFTELRGLQNIIFAADASSQVTIPPGIGAMVRQQADTTYILAVNPGGSTVTGDFHVQNLQAGQTIAVLFENRTITADDGTFTDTFSPTSRHVYALSGLPNPGQ